MEASDSIVELSHESMRPDLNEVRLCLLIYSCVCVCVVRDRVCVRSCILCMGVRGHFHRVG